MGSAMMLVRLVEIPGQSFLDLVLGLFQHKKDSGVRKWLSSRALTAGSHVIQYNPLREFDSNPITSFFAASIIDIDKKVLSFFGISDEFQTHNSYWLKPTMDTISIILNEVLTTRPRSIGQTFHLQFSVSLTQPSLVAMPWILKNALRCHPLLSKCSLRVFIGVPADPQIPH
jgi:hypothetical protein